MVHCEWGIGKTMPSKIFMFLGMCIAYASASRCTGKVDRGPNNLQPILTSPPVFVKSVENASLYTVGSGDDTIQVVHLWGDAYSKGFAQGKLLGPSLHSFYDRVMPYFVSQFEQAINGSVPWIPEKIAKVVAQKGVTAGLEWQWSLCESYTGKYLVQEMQGLSDGSGVAFETIRNVHMIGELTQGSCSMYGAWGTSTFQNKTLQLRALDWDTDGPFQDFSQVTVYHKYEGEEGGGEQTFANVGWTGWLGSITGMSENRLAISEIGVSFPDNTFGPEARKGVPFVFLLRDILQFDVTLAQAQSRITNAVRTCNLILGVGDGKSNDNHKNSSSSSSNNNKKPFRGVQYAHTHAEFYDDENMKPDAHWHPKIKDVVYFGMDWICPGTSKIIADQLNALHGSLTPENTIKTVTSVAKTGDLHIAVYDLSDDVMYVANARGTNEKGAQYAYERSFVRMNMTDLWKTVPKPNSVLKKNANTHTRTHTSA